LETHFDPALPPLQGDAGQIRQVVINLVQNAIQAMPAGGTLSLRATRGFLRGNPAITIEVEDTGGGIPADILRNIFNPFFTTKSKGTGLGLSVCNRIVELHRGALEVVNTARGACLRVHLPVSLTPAGEH
jgi:signal transduction histidine kinase